MRRFLTLPLLIAASVVVSIAAAPAGAASRTGWTTERAAPEAGLYEVVVSLRAPAAGRTVRVRVTAERSRSRLVALRPDRGRRRVRVRLRAWVKDGQMSVRVSGSPRRRDVQAWSPRVVRSVLVRPQQPAPRVGTTASPEAPTPATPPAPAEAPPAEPVAQPAAQRDPPAGEPANVRPLPLPERLVWAEEFDGAAGASPNSRNWNLIQGGHGWGNNELQTFTGRPENVALDGRGDLAITARKETYTGNDRVRRGYTSGRIDTKGKFSFAYGRLEASIRIPAGKGLWPAFWVMGDDVQTAGWPNCGEMDVMEAVGDSPSVVHGTLHGPVGFTQTSWAQGRSFTAPGSLADGFHTYRLVWTPTAVEWALDGVVYSRLSPADLPAGARWAFDHRFHILLSLTVGGSWPGSPDAATPFPSEMLVDWVRVYRSSPRR